jgi:hypothetical protein
VLQAFNVHWFVNATKGIGIETTFNDDQGARKWGTGEVTEASDMLRGVGIRLLHRLVRHLIGETP